MRNIIKSMEEIRVYWTFICKKKIKVILMEFSMKVINKEKNSIVAQI